MRRAIIALILSAAATATLAQPCPKENPNGPNIESESRTLSGKVVFRDEIRQWFGLQLTAPVCGVREVQLLQGGGAFEVDESNAHVIEIYRGCNVTVQGSLGIPGTGYYSAEIYQNVDGIDAAPDCVRQPPLPDYSRSRPDSSVSSYRVSMQIDYKARGGRIVVAAHSGARTLIPWQAYASYWLTGGYVFYAHCAEGFDLTRYGGTPESKPAMFDDNMLGMDPEAAAAKHVTQLRLDYTCRRETEPISHSTR